jgi:hypothetical protein
MRFAQPEKGAPSGKGRCAADQQLSSGDIFHRRFQCTDSQRQKGKGQKKEQQFPSDFQPHIKSDTALSERNASPEGSGCWG